MDSREHRSKGSSYLSLYRESRSDNIFSNRKFASLDSMESFVGEHRRSHVNPDHEGVAHRRTSKSIRSTRLLAPSLRVSGDSNNPSHSFNPLLRRSRHAKSVTSTNNNSARAHLYAGITHSDLDIITSRPPLMHQMHILEWAWLQSTVSHRMIIMLLAVLFSVAVINFGYSVSLLFEKEVVPNPYRCTSPACFNLAKRLRKTMNSSVNPCNDFYAFMCGTSDVVQLPKDQELYWQQGFDSGRVSYDYAHSPSLGRMLKKTNRFPENLVLTLYRGCLQKRKRENLGLQPYYDVLKTLKLYDVNKLKPLTTENVIDSIALIIGHSFTRSGIINLIYYTPETKLTTFLITATSEQIRFGAVHRYGFLDYLHTVKEAFKLLTELEIPEDEIDIIAHDITCLEMFFKDGSYGPKGPWERLPEDRDKSGEPCYVHTESTSPPKANFGNPVNTPFNYTLLVHTLYKIANPTNPVVPPDFPLDPQNNDNTDKDYLAAFEKEFTNSAPIRILRYLQWRMFYSLAFELNQKATDIMITVKRYSYLGPIANCFDSVFAKLPFVSANRFLEQSSSDISEIEGPFQTLSEEIDAMIGDFVIHENSFKQFLDVLKEKGPPFNSFTEREVTLLRHIIDALLISRLEHVQTSTFHSGHFPTYQELYQNITFDENTHVANLLKMGHLMHQWKANPHFKSAYFSIDWRYRVPIWIDRVRHAFLRANNEYLLFLPIGLTEVPFFRDGLYVSDLSGMGLTNTGVHFRLFFASFVGYSEPTSQSKFAVNYAKTHLRNLYANFSYTTEDELLIAIDQIFRGLEIYAVHLMDQFREQRQLWPWITGGKKWGPLEYNSSDMNVLQTLLVDQSRYNMLQRLVEKHFSHPEYKFESKLVLPSLENYNAKQLFYMTLVQRRCEALGSSKLAHLRKFGPLSQAMRHNIVLSNLDDFSKSFNCSAGSPMNATNKVYFFDR